MYSYSKHQVMYIIPLALLMVLLLDSFVYEPSINHALRAGFVNYQHLETNS